MEILKLNEADAVKFIKSIDNAKEPNEALKQAKKSSKKLLKRRDV
jgi:uncharacterized protein (DUF1778 family)